MEALRYPEFSPQLSAVAYGRQPYIPIEPMIEEQAQYLPQLYQQRAQEEYFNEQLRLANQEQRQARRDANISLGIKGAELGYSAYRNPTLQRYGQKVLSALTPKPWQSPATNNIPVDYLHTPVSTGTSVPLNMPLIPDPTSVPNTPVFPNIDTFRVNPESSMINTGGNRLVSNAIRGTVSDTGEVSWMSQPTAPTGFSGILPQGTGMVSGIARSTLPSLAGTAASALVERSNVGEFLHKRGVMGKKEADLALGTLGGVATGFMIGGPIGAIGGGISSFLRGLF